MKVNKVYSIDWEKTTLAIIALVNISTTVQQIKDGLAKVIKDLLIASIRIGKTTSYNS